MISKGIISVLMLLLSCFKTAWFSAPAPAQMAAANVQAAEITYVSYTYGEASDGQKEFPTEPGKKLVLDMETGASLTIQGWEKNSISVQLNRKGRDDRNSELNYKQTPEGLEISSEYQGDRGSYSSDLDLEIMVPSRYNIEIDSSGGDLNITNVDGNISGKTMGGELTLAELKGNLKLTTMGGDISLKDSVVDGEVKTMGGDVTLQDVSGTVEGSTMGGNVVYNNVKKNAASSVKKEVKVNSMGGEIKVDEAPYGADVKTMGGDIEVHSASEYVKAETMGGNINIDAVDGWIRAKTMGGDVIANMVGSASKDKRDVDITSYGGDITLTVPEGLPMNFDIELAYTKNREGDYKIISDFAMDQKESSGWDDHDGTPRRYINGTGSVNGGSNTIKIRTINGDVRIKKAGK